jgi:hypothetical protein
MVLALQPPSAMREPAIAAESEPLVPDKFERCPLTMRSVFAATLAIVAYVGVVAPKRTRVHGYVDTNVDVATRAVTKYANEGYPAWALDHGRRVCPASLYELDRYMTSWHQPDPWGHEYFSTCADGKIYVGSLGADGKSNTADDIWSHQ